MVSSRRDLFIDTVVDRFIYTNTQKAFFSVLPFNPKQIWDYPKQGLVFTVNLSLLFFYHLYPFPHIS